jgi:membrane protein implicated in regulation of membrane protease activity
MNCLRSRLFCGVAVGVGASLLGGAGVAIAAVALLPVATALVYVMRRAPGGTKPASTYTL